MAISLNIHHCRHRHAEMDLIKRGVGLELRGQTLRLIGFGGTGASPGPARPSPNRRRRHILNLENNGSFDAEWTSS